jgi:hypothetical protein
MKCYRFAANAQVRFAPEPAHASELRHQLSPTADIMSKMLTAAMCRFCCKSLFALVIKISFGCAREFCVKMWGTSSPEDKLAGNLGNVIEAISTGGRRVGFFLQHKISAEQFGTLQQYLPQPDAKFLTQ